MELKVITPTWDIAGTYFIVDQSTAEEKTKPADDLDEGPYSYCEDSDLVNLFIEKYNEIAGRLPRMAVTETFAMATFTDGWHKAEITLF